MAGNIKAGIMATTTMVGSAWAYTKANTADGQAGEANTMAGMRGHRGQIGGQGGAGAGGCNNQHRQHDKYQDTVQQMMHWKY